MALTKVTLSGAVDNIKEGWTKFNDLIDDLLATTNGLGASTIGVEDSAGNMAAANVETALAEIYTDTTASRSLADVFDENTATTTGTTWGYKGGLIRIDNTVTTIAASTVALSDDATNYVEIDTSGNVTKNTTSFTSGKIPIRQITVASGVQTVSTDKRAWFTTWAAAAVATTGISKLTAGFVNRPKFVYVERLAYTSGSEEPSEGDKLVGATGGGEAIVELVELSTGTWAGGTAAGNIFVHTRNATAFQSENLNIDGGTANVCTISAASAKDSVVIYPGEYHHLGSTDQNVYWTGKFGFVFQNLGTSDWSYLYIDDSAIVTAASDVLTATQMVDAVTEPAWSDAKAGWYNSLDRCILGVLTDGSDNILEFFHDNNLIMYADHITDRGAAALSNTFVDVTLSAPVFARSAIISVYATYTDAGVAILWRTNGQTGTTGHQCAIVIAATSTEDGNTFRVVTDSAQKIEIKADSAGTTSVVGYTNGFYLPNGI